MLKLVYLVIMVLFSTKAIAFESSISYQSGSIPKATSVNNDIQIINFSQEHLNAVKNCTPFIEKSTDNLSGMTVEFITQINGRNHDGKCAVSHIQNFVGMAKTTLNCLYSNDNLNELYAAMQDKSTTPVTKTFITKQPYNANGEQTEIHQETTMTDSLYKVTLEEINAKSCKLVSTPPDSLETKDLEKQISTFSDEFLTSLVSCLPDVEEKGFLFFKQKYEIMGSKNGKCHIYNKPFNIYVPSEKLADIKTIEDMNKITENDNNIVYVPEYNYSRLLKSINDCANNQSYKGPKQTISFFENKVVQTFESALENNNCKIIFGNTLTRNNIKKDYSLTCVISPENTQYIKQTFAMLFNNNTDKKQDAIKKANELIFKKIKEAGYCNISNNQ